jgi:hypothetical protein
MALGQPLGIRKAPAPQGLPGYIRIDTVHQGDLDGLKGVYHINAVDIVTQWELVALVEHISEAYLLPVISLLLEGFPLRHPRLSFRFGLGVRQPQNRRIAGEIAHRIHQVTTAPDQ